MSMRKAPGLQLQTSIVQDNVPVEIAPNLFVGSIHAAFNVEALKSSRITHVLNLAGTYATFPDDFTYLSLSIRDKEYASLLSCLPIAAVFISAGLKKGGVLVHCSGGRSRSPAFAMAYLIMKQQLSYLFILNHVKTLRPVISLNAGFDAQLKCLEIARGNVFVANQLLLKARLARLAQKKENGELQEETARTRRQKQGELKRLSTPPKLKKQSSIQMLFSGSDERGMIGERVPSGFCLSIPVNSGCLSESPEKTYNISFIPALRSMGTMFGCEWCGQSLFCAGAIVFHHDIAKFIKRTGGCPVESKFLEALRDLPISRIQDNVVVSDAKGKGEDIAAAPITKKPLLAKLRLRPHSPSVLMGKSVGAVTKKSSIRRKSAPFTQLTAHVEFIKSQKYNDMSKPFRLPQPDRRLCNEQCDRTSSISLSPAKVGEESKKNSGSGIWRSLTSFRSPKRVSKFVTENKRIYHRFQHLTGKADVQKPVGLSKFADAKFADICQSAEHKRFLEQNAIEWNRKLKQLVNIEKNDFSQISAQTAIDHMTALLDEDLTVFRTLNDCHHWFIDPQPWTIGQAAEHPEGVLRCPRETCGAIVGEWRWNGLTYPCGGGVAPAFVMKKTAVRVLGNLTSQTQ
ncbi:putative Dual specificity phosphatase, catalytic domain, protein-tyrosine phosphatase [Plasmopara halstedii]